MATPTPLWKKVFDVIDQRLGPTVNDLARSDDMVAITALSRRGRSEIERRLEQVSRRALHMLNLPAGSDVNRLLEHIARLEREVHDLRNELGDRENAEYLASLAERHASAESPAAKRKRASPSPRQRAG